MYFLIPALVNSDESERLLNLTLKHIPPSEDSIAVVVSQGRRPRLDKPSNVRNLVLQHYENPLRKWVALSLARDVVPSNETQVVLLDADDPIEPFTFAEAISKSLLRPATCWIGQRTEIALYAEDELSNDSRFFLEMFSNTLLLSKASPPSPVLLDPPDIQSGFYVLPASTFKRLTFDYVEDYGGELALCFQLWQAGTVTANLSYSAQYRNASSYRLQQIVNQILRLPFFRDVTEDDIEEAKMLAPDRYRQYFNEQRLAMYEKEMERIMAYAKLREDSAP